MRCHQVGDSFLSRRGAWVVAFLSTISLQRRVHIRFRTCCFVQCIWSHHSSSSAIYEEHICLHQDIVMFNSIESHEFSNYNLFHLHINSSKSSSPLSPQRPHPSSQSNQPLLEIDNTHTALSKVLSLPNIYCSVSS